MMKRKNNGCLSCGVETPLRAARPRLPRKYCDACLIIRKREIALAAARSPKHAEANRRTAEARRGSKNLKITGELHHAWKGDNVGIDALHAWVDRHAFNTGHCEHCGTPEKKLEWANKSQQYKRVLDDWLRLCRSCHLKFDNKAGVRNGSKKAVFSGLL